MLPDGLEATRQFGPRLEGLVTYFHHEHHMGFERTQTVLQYVLGLSISEGGAVAILERAGEVAQPEVAAIGEQVRQSAVIGSDETSARVNGRNQWEWVFLSPQGEFHLIVPSRGQDVIDAFMRFALAAAFVRGNTLVAIQPTPALFPLMSRSLEESQSRCKDDGRRNTSYLGIIIIDLSATMPITI